ncbi:uncharacterized protein LOC135502581 [Lineus longissimus]|uniref:uncharacterized protein LOC135502581 n=1 Tax=Lineus longissimus TaxID=88925 RepID=UPI00315CD447
MEVVYVEESSDDAVDEELIPTPAILRLDKMSTLVFDRDNLRQVQDAVDDLFAILFDLIADDEGCARNTHKEMLDKLNDVDIRRWSNIRSKFLEEPYYGYADGDFTIVEEKDFVKLMMDLINSLEKTRSQLTTQIQCYYDVATSQKKEIKVLQVELLRYQEENMEMKWKNSQEKAELLAVKSSMTQLQKNLKGKQEDINQLQRDGTVQLWEKEKHRILEAADKREKELTAEVDRLKKENEDMKEKFTRRLIESDDQFKRLKMKQELQLKPTNDQKDKEMDLLNKKVYLLEKDLTSMEQEFLKYQKYYCAITHGIQRDFKILCERFQKKANQDEVSGPDKLTRRDMSRLAERLSTIFASMMQGRLLLMLADLPDHYLMLEKDMKPVSVRKLSLAYTSNKNSPTNPPGHIPDKSPTAIALENAEKMLIRRESRKHMTPRERRASVQERQTSADNGASETIIEKGPGADDELPLEAHPELVYRETNRVNFIACMRYFPHMGRDYVFDQWEQFQKYDANGDYALDLTEMMTAMTSTIGQQFNAQQIKEAMIEVDIDGSDTIDFYEYLTIANMLSQKTGKSNVFRSELAQKQGSLVSRTCAIQ